LGAIWTFLIRRSITCRIRRSFSSFERLISQ
jgi:hypothetical protein